MKPLIFSSAQKGSTKLYKTLFGIQVVLMIFSKVEILVVESVRLGNLGHKRFQPYNEFPSPKMQPVNVMKDKLGKDFNPDFVSWNFTNKTTLSPRKSPPKNSEDYLESLSYIQKLDFSYEDERGRVQTMRSDIRKVLERWLLTQRESNCRVRHTWHDMGPMFWPRYVKHGECDSDVGGYGYDENNSCSWPPGMHCVAAKSHVIKILNWNCKKLEENNKRSFSWRRHKRALNERRVKSYRPGHRDILGRSVEQQSLKSKRSSMKSQQHQKSQIKCKWKKIPYPITNECFCSC